ncbi:MAG: sigma 54-interacting transcriptional regulator [Nitrospirota bacterium]
MLCGVSLAWKQLMMTVEQAARTDSPTLILGEPGSGKDAIARTLHQLSRRDGPLVSFRSLALERPAFASVSLNGTLLVDDIGLLPGQAQRRLLEFIEKGRSPSDRESATAHCRIIATSSSDLQELILAGRFLDDLLYRIASVRIHVSPLRDRPEDIPVLVEHFLRLFHRPGLPPRRVAPSAVEALLAYSWPGNVRELRDVVERLLLPAQSGPVEASDVAAILDKG